MNLIADSGSTKTDWVLVDASKVQYAIQTEGITPIHQSEDEILQILLSAQKRFASMSEAIMVDSVFFYGSGILENRKSVMDRLLRQVFCQANVVEVDNDLLGAARALCGNQMGIACILGTGSNSCLFDGKQIIKNTPPLGYILGDEGSGAALGKLFLNALFKGELDFGVREDYLASVKLTYSELIDRVYRQPLANRFLATTSLFIHEHLDIPELQQLVVANFRQFIRKNIMPYQRPDLAINAIGSMAWYYQNQLADAVALEGYKMGLVMKSPMEGLIPYHSDK